jgi:hypothetical protein
MDTDISLADIARTPSAQATGPQRTYPTDAHTDRPEFSLPQADGGRKAWLFLAACFVVEALVWGKALPLLVALINFSLREKKGGCVKGTSKLFHGEQNVSILSPFS